MDLRVGIVGAGGIGKLLAKVLINKGFRVKLYDIDRGVLRRAELLGFEITGYLSELINWCDHAVIAVPPNEVLNTLRSIRYLLSNYSLSKVVYDVTTFKEGLISEYLRFPKYVKVTSIHPMFGTGMRSLEKHVVLITPIPSRESDTYEVELLYSELGFKVIRLGIEEHDDLVATYVGTSYVIATLIANYVVRNDLMSKGIYGTTFKYLLTHCLAVMRDKEEFIGYVLSNERVRRRVRELISILNDLLRSNDEVIKSVRLLKELIRSEVINTAYEVMYDVIEGSLGDLLSSFST